MHPSLSVLLEFPSLIHAITSQEFNEYFPRVSINRAKSYIVPGIITNVRASPVINGGIVVQASVQGTRRTPYRVSVEFIEDGITGDWNIDASCTCPVGFNCKHNVAVMIQLGSLLRELKQRTNTPTSNSGLPRHIETWLRSIETADHSPTAQDQPKSKAPHSRFLAYCIELSEDDEQEIHFALHPATRIKDGEILIEPQLAQADPTKPSQYMVDEDIPAAVVYQQIARKQQGWGRITLEGPEAARLLNLAHSTGRLFIGKEIYTHRASTNYRIVSKGEPVHVSPGWFTDASGVMKPALEDMPDGLLLVRSIPWHYVDPATASFGILTSGVSYQVLDLWLKGPAIAPDNVALLGERLGSIASSTLPPPLRMETEIRPQVAPAAFLHIQREELEIDDDTIELIYGFATLRYGDSPPLRITEEMVISPELSEVRDGKRIVWKRDLDAEDRILTALQESGLLLFNEIAGSDALPDSYSHAFVTESTHPTPALAWLIWLEAEAPRLREVGWTIIIDPMAGLTTHEVASFSPDIVSESTHGIDWFRFDVSFEVDGVKRSLIPLIAQAIEDGFPPSTTPDLPEWVTLPCENPADGFIRLPTRRFLEIVDQVRHLFHGRVNEEGPLRLDRLAAAGIADRFALHSSETNRALATLGRSLKDIRELPQEVLPEGVKATLRPYQHEGFRWLRFLTKHHLNGILADDMGLGKTLQTLTHLAAEHAEQPGKPSLVVAPTSVVPNWAAEAARFVPGLKVVIHQGADRISAFKQMQSTDLVITSYPLLHRDIEQLARTQWHCVILDEAQYIKNPKSITTQAACALPSAHRLCLSGTPMENHLGELWSLMHFLMPGYLPIEKTFNSVLRRPIERDRSAEAQQALNHRVSPLILRRTKDQVATDLPPKTEIIHHIELTKKQIDIYESVRATMDKRVREAIAAKGLAQSHIIVLDALLKLRQICCHPSLLNSPAAEKVNESAKLAFLTDDLLPQLLEEGRRILLFSQFTSMLALIEAHLEKNRIPFLKLTGQTKDRASLVTQFQSGEVPVFLISLKAGGTGLNLTAADTVIHYDPWWNPAAENQATDRAHRIGQNKPVFVHKLVCRGSIEDRILELQNHKSTLVKALLSEETTSLRIDPETLSHLLEPIG